MVEGTGKRAKTTDRHIVTLSPELSEQLDEALEIARLRTLLKPVEATLGNPVAFPILAGFLGVGIGALLLKLWFPDPLKQARSEIEKAADEIARVLEESKGLELTEPFIEATKATLLFIYDRVLDVAGFLGGREFKPGEDPIIDL